MNHKTVCRRRAIASVDPHADILRNRALLLTSLEEIFGLIRDGSDDVIGLREKCEGALPLWKSDLEAKRADQAACGNVRPDQPGDRMVKLTLEAGAAGLSTDEIARLQEPIWPSLVQWIREHRAADGQLNRSNAGGGAPD